MITEALDRLHTLPNPRLTSTFPTLRPARATGAVEPGARPDSDVPTNTHHKGPVSKLTVPHE